jgi:histone deacetylase 6
VASKELNSAAAIIRPPGHHAEPDEAMGFCLFNNVAIAASYLLNENVSNATATLNFVFIKSFEPLVGLLFIILFMVLPCE